MAESLGQTMHALHNSLNSDPFKLAKLSRDTGISPAAVDNDFSFGQKKLRSDKFAEQLQFFNDNHAERSPVTLQYLTDLDNNADALALTLDRHLLELESSLPENRQAGWGHISGAWEAGMLQREANTLLQKPLFQGVPPTEEEEERLSVISRTLQYQAEKKKEMGLFPRMARGAVESLGVPLFGMVSQGAQFAPAGMAAGAALGASTGAAVGGVGALPGAVSGGFAGLGAGMAAGGVRDIFEQEAASIYGELRGMTDDYGDKMHDGTARALAIAGGLANAGLEYVGFHFMGKVIPGLDKLLDKGAVSGALTWLNKNPSALAKLGQGALSALKAVAAETGTEVLQEHVGMAAEELGRRSSNIDVAAISGDEYLARIGEVIEETVIATALPMGLAGGARAYRDIRHQSRYDEAMKTAVDNRNLVLDKLAETARNSRVFEELPETGEELLTALAENGAIADTVYIRPEAAQRVFFQSGVDETGEMSGGSVNPEFGAIAAELGISPESLQENLTLGTDVAVPVQKAARHLFRNEGLYNALRGDMRFEPEVPTDAELERLLSMNRDTEARAAYIDALLGGVVEEMDEAQNRHDRRMDLTLDIRTQLVNSGMTEERADAYGMLWAVNAERMAPLFGQSPGEYLQSRMAGFMETTPEGFQGWDSLEERMEQEAMSEMKRAAMADMGVTPNMSRTQKRRILQPEFGHAYGRLNPESIINTYGKEVYNDLRRRFGPGFFAKKGEGTQFDVMAQEFVTQERGGYFNADHVDAFEFMEKVMMPHDEFESSWGVSIMYQSETARLADEALARDAEAFAAEVDKVEAAGVAPQNPVVMLRQTPLVLQMIGRDVLSGKEAGNNGIFVSPHTFRNVLEGRHPLTWNMLKRIPEAMADPIMIFDSAGKRTRGDVVFMLEMTDDNGATVIVPVMLRAKDEKRIEIDVVKSAYAKEDDGVPNNEWFRREAEKRARYVNRKKTERWQRDTGVQFPVATLTNASGNKIYTDADLVKLRQENPTLYQYAGDTRTKFDAAPRAAVPANVIKDVPASGKIGELKKFLKKWAEYHGLFKNYKNSDTGWDIEVNANSIKNVLGHGGHQDKIQAIAAIPQLLANGILLESGKKNEQGLLSHVFAAKLDIGGKRLVAGFVVREDVNGKRYYDHELTEIRNLDDPAEGKPDAIGLDTERAIRDRQGDVINIVRSHIGVKPSLTLYQPASGGMTLAAFSRPEFAKQRGKRVGMDALRNMLKNVSAADRDVMLEVLDDMPPAKSVDFDEFERAVQDSLLPLERINTDNVIFFGATMGKNDIGRDIIVKKKQHCKNCSM
jgi:hypothetical protein